MVKLTVLVAVIVGYELYNNTSKLSSSDAHWKVEGPQSDRDNHGLFAVCTIQLQKIITSLSFKLPFALKSEALPIVSRRHTQFLFLASRCRNLGNGTRLIHLTALVHKNCDA